MTSQSTNKKNFDVENQSKQSESASVSEFNRIRSETEKVIEDAKLIRDNLKQQIDGLYALGKEKGIDIDKFFSEFNPLTEEQMQFLLKEKEALDLEQESNLTSNETSAPSNESQDSLAKKHKSSLRGARNKWIPIK